VLLVAHAGSAQDPASAPAPRRLAAFFWHDSPNDLAALDGIRQGLEIAGVRHDLTVLQAGGDADRARSMVEQLRAGRYELLFAMGTQACLLLSASIHDVPIVYTAVTNPVASEVVRSWEGSGRNLAGASNWIPPDTVLRVFQKAVPGLSRLGMLRSRNAGVVSAAELQAMRAHLTGPRAAKVEIVEAVVDDAAGIGAAVRTLLAAKVQAIWVPIDFTIYRNMERVREALGTSPVPLVSSALQGARNGAVAGVLVDYVLLGRRTAALALDVLNGRRTPAEIPVDTMRGYQVIVNLGVARRSGYELPLSLLAVADVLIDDDLPEQQHGKR
jgi:putative ABC transport system substrate-binding protein